MTEQDATDAGPAGAGDADDAANDGAATDDGAETGGSEADDAGSSETVEEIAERPDEQGAVEEVLSELAGAADAAGDEADPERLAQEVERLRERTSSLEAELEEREAEVEDLESRLKRKQADFQNYKRRQEERIEEIRERATEDLIERLLDVRDNLQRALDQDDDADIRDGIESTLEQFDQELDRENVSVIDPDAGETTDPTRHQVLMRFESDWPEGTIVDVHRPGYEMAGKVIRPAQVTVSEGPDSASGSDDAGEQ